MVWPKHERRASTNSVTTISTRHINDLTPWRKTSRRNSSNGIYSTSASCVDTITFSMNSVLRGEIIPAVPITIGNGKRRFSKNADTRDTTVSNNRMQGLMTRKLRNLISTSEDNHDCNSKEEDEQSFKLAKSNVLKEAGESRKKFHDNVHKMGTEDWQEFQKTLRQTRTLTNAGLAMAINCHFVDHSLEVSNALISAPPSNESQESQIFSLGSTTQSVDGEQFVALNGQQSRRGSVPLALEERRHLVKRSSLKLLKQKSLQNGLELRRSTCSNIQNNSKDIAGRLGSQVVRMSATIGRQMSVVGTRGPPVSHVAAKDNLQVGEWRVVERKPRRTSSITHLVRRAPAINVKNIYGNDEGEDKLDGDIADVCGSNSKNQEPLGMEHGTKNISERTKDAVQDNFTHEGSEDEMDEPSLYFPSRNQRVKAKEHRRGYTSASCSFPYNGYDRMIETFEFSTSSKDRNAYSGIASAGRGTNANNIDDTSKTINHASLSVAEAARLVAWEDAGCSLSDDEGSDEI